VSGKTSDASLENIDLKIPPKGLSSRATNTSLKELLVRARACLHQKRFREARATFARMGELSQDDWRIDAGLACVAEAECKWTEANELWNQCAVTAPADGRIQAIARMGRCHIETGAVEVAKTIFSSIGDQFEGMAGFAHIADLVDSQASALRWQQCMQQYPDRLEGFLGAALNLHDRLQFADADQLLSHVVAVWPKSSIAAVAWARSPAASRDWETSQARWETVVAKHAGDDFAIRTYARCLATVDNLDYAAVLDANLSEAPMALLEFAVARATILGDFTLAIAHARKLARWEPEEPAHRLLLAWLLVRAGLKETLREAIDNLLEIRAASSHSVTASVCLIVACIKAGLDSDARNYLASIASADARADVRILSAWDALTRDACVADVQRWKTIFIDFDMLAERECALAERRRLFMQLSHSIQLSRSLNFVAGAL
jgi:Flp pilus assembly protein TadD